MSRRPINAGMSSVASLLDLPKTAIEGTIVYVNSSLSMYMYTKGQWSKITNSLEEPIEDVVHKMNVRLDLITLNTAEVIDAKEFKRLLNMYSSPDDENRTIAAEIITNKMKEPDV